MKSDTLADAKRIMAKLVKQPPAPKVAKAKTPKPTKRAATEGKRGKK